MKITIERTKFEPNYKDGVPTSWDVAFDIETDTGLKLYTPITIEYRDVKPPATEAAVTVHAWKEVIPSQIWHLYKDVNVLTEIDELALEAYKEEVALEREQKQSAAITKQREEILARTKQRLEDAKIARQKLREQNEQEKLTVREQIENLEVSDVNSSNVDK